MRNDDQRLRKVLIEAELYNEKQDYDSAFELLSSELQEMPDNKDLLYSRALVAEKIDKLDVMEQDLKKIISQNPDDVSALNALGYTLVDRTERYAEAQEYLEKAIQLKPNEAVILDSYGWLQFKLNNYEVAYDYLKRAYSLQKENEIAAHLIEVLWRMGRTKESLKLYKKTIKNSPSDKYLLEVGKKYFNR